MTATTEKVKVGETELTVHQDNFSFTVPQADKIKPEQSHMAGKKYEKTFSFPQVSDNDEAEAVCKAKEWTLVDFVNDALKSNARSSAYQAESALYRISEVSPDEIRERMIRDYIRLGVPEDVARTQVTALLNAQK